jgi:hypothetical protein
MIAGAVGLAGVLSAVVAQALPGTSASSATPSGGTTSTVPATSPATSPATDPSVTSPSGGSNLTPATSPPVVTHQHSVARSGAS